MSRGVSKYLSKTCPIFDHEMGVRMTYARRKMQLKQDELCVILEISQDALSRIETVKKGKEHVCAGLKMSRLFATMKKHLDYLFFGLKREEYEKYRFVRTDRFGNLTHGV